MSNDYKPINPDKFDNSYFYDRFFNNPKRMKQFKLDGEFVKKFIQKGEVLDFGCSTGEFSVSLNWDSKIYGSEINEYAKSKAKKYLKFNKDIFTVSDYFDAIIFRGTIQHIDEPFRIIKKAYSALKTNGYLLFIATPNINSLSYKFNKVLPALDLDKNYYLPGNFEFTNALRNLGFEKIHIEYPYLSTPYKNLVMDHAKFLINLFLRTKFKHAFWGNMMNIAVQKR